MEFKYSGNNNALWDFRGKFTVCACLKPVAW